MTKILKVVGASWLQTKISSYILGILGILAIMALFVGQIERIQEDGTYAATVFYSEKTGYRIEHWGQSNKLEDIARGVARAYFKLNTDTGWSVLEVETNGSYPDEIQAYAAGIVEGDLTWYLIHIHLENTIRAQCLDPVMEKQCDKLRDSLDKSVNTWKTYAENREEDPFWHQVALYYTQINGIYTGWNHGMERSLNEFETDISDLFWLNSLSEVAEMQHKLNITVEDKLINNLPGLSSAFMRTVNESTADGIKTKLYLAQNAVGSYSSMTRILKRYKFNYHLTSQEKTPVPGVTTEFTSYPGSVTSHDEFYLINGDDHRMAVTGTTLRNYNSKLWKDTNFTEQVPIGPRVMAANHLASNVSSWGHTLATSNSGTACKQWLVVDFNRFDQVHSYINDSETVKTTKTDVVTLKMINNKVRHTVVHRSSSGRGKGLVWLIEQVPGRTHSADISDTFLEQGYWATFGLPFFKDIADVTHLNIMEEHYGQVYSEKDSPRAILFKNGYKNATTLDNIIKLMRQNNVTALYRARNVTVPCAEDMKCLIEELGYTSVLGVRGDLVKNHKMPIGVIDTKIVMATANVNKTEFYAISGPPFTNVTQKNTTSPLNKGNIASIYTDKFDDEPSINGLKIRVLIKHQQEEAEQESLDILNRDVVKPFTWSKDYSDISHLELPETWDFGPFQPQWYW